MSPLTSKPVLHGRDHCPGGADPIPCLAAAGGLTYTDAVLAETSLWAYWPLNDTAGNPHEELAGRDMTAVEGSPYTLTYGQPGPTSGDLALEFVGTDSGIVPNAGTRSYYDLATGEEAAFSAGFTVELWFWAATPAELNQAGAVNYNGSIASHGTDLANTWELYLDPAGTLKFVVGGEVEADGTTLGASLVLSAVPTLPETWVHAAVTYDNTTVRLYLDGGLADSGTASTGIGHRRFQIGRQAPTTPVYSRHLEGRLAHVALYTGALDAAAVAGHVEATGGSGGGTPGPPGEGVPVGGTAGQVLTKDTGTDFDTSWQTPTGGGGASATDTAVWLPLTTVVSSVPELVWDANNSLIPTFTPI